MPAPTPSGASPADVASADLVARLAEDGDVTRRAMFGGYGLFCPHGMFGLVNRNGRAYFKTDAATAERYVAAGSERHGRMPYYAVPEAVLIDDATLRRWADEARAVAARS